MDSALFLVIDLCECKAGVEYDEILRNSSLWMQDMGLVIRKGCWRRSSIPSAAQTEASRGARWLTSSITFCPPGNDSNSTFPIISTLERCTGQPMANFHVDWTWSWLMWVRHVAKNLCSVTQQSTVLTVFTLARFSMLRSHEFTVPLTN